MLSGTISLYIDPKNPKYQWAKPVMLGIVIMSGLFTIGFSYKNYQGSKFKELELAKDKEILQEKIDKLTIQNQQLLEEIKSNPKKMLEGVKTLFLSFGYTKKIFDKATKQELQQSKEANQALTSEIEIASQNDIQRRKTITVEYFPKDVDPKIVESKLKELGFNFKSSSPNVKNLSTNAIWFGSKVDITDVKLVAYTLIRAGVKIQTIKPFRQPNQEPWASKIQVGADGDYVNSSPLTIEQIKNTLEFTRP